MQVGLVGRGTHLDLVLDRCRTERGGAMLVGPAGIGKTRLLGEAVAVLEADGWHLERFVASEATGSVPFGPLMTLLPFGGGERTQLHASVRQELRDRSAGRDTVIAVDDAHLLDPASTACIIDLVHHGDVVVLLAARNDGGLSPDLTRLWSSDALIRVEVDPLGHDDTLALAAALLGGSVESQLAAQLVELAEGVPLLLRELVLDGKGLGVIEEVEGEWRQTGPLSSGNRLQELVAARVRQLDPASGRVFELVTLGEPVRIELLADEECEAVDRLERQGLVQVERSVDGWRVRVDHPLLGEALRAGLPTRRRVEVLRDLARRTVEDGCRGRGDALRVVRWSAETGDDVDADVAIVAGREALAALDLDLAAELAERAVGEREFEGHLLLGEVRRLQARAGEAEASLALAAEMATDDDTIVRIAMWRSTLFAHHVGEPAAAIQLLEDAIESVSDPSRALELASEASYLAGILGQFDHAVRTNRGILAHDGLDDATTWTARINLIYAQTMLGQLDGVDEHIEGAMSMVERVETVRPEGVDLLWAMRTGIALERGELEHGERETVAHIARCEERGTIFGATGAILQQLLLVRGSSNLLPLAARTLEDIEGSDPYAIRPIALACATLSRVAVGDLDGARESFGAIPESAVDDVRAASFVGRAEAALTFHDDEARGAALAAEYGRDSIERLHVAFGLLALYDAVLWGRPELVVDDLIAGADGTSAALFGAMARHGEALHTGDPVALERVGSSFGRMGARPLAAAAFADAARVHEHETEARRAGARSMQWARAAAPMVAPPVEVEGAVSERELDVAVEAAAGRPSREIGDQLFLSVRTVDNHVRHVYSKLDVSGRDELRRVLQPMP